MLSVQDGIQAARLTLPRTYFDRRKCFEGVEALKLYRREWDDDKKIFRDKPLHDWTSHTADAFRELSIAWQEDHKPKEPAPTRWPLDRTISEIIARQTRRRLENE
jgi:hypothetical protein